MARTARLIRAGHARALLACVFGEDEAETSGLGDLKGPTPPREARLPWGATPMSLAEFESGTSPRRQAAAVAGSGANVDVRDGEAGFGRRGRAGREPGDDREESGRAERSR
jgi:hypothetical protein